MNFDFKKECRAIISVVGASEIDKETENLTIELGRLLAKNNYVISGQLFKVADIVVFGFGNHRHGPLICFPAGRTILDIVNLLAEHRGYL